MSFEERCEVTAMISKRNDPLAVLPVELVIEILSHLPILAPWQLQRVNSRWRLLLSSQSILRTSLVRWQTHSASDSARDPLQVEKDPIKAKVRHMQALRLGCPFTTAHLTGAPHPTATLKDHVIDLKGSRLAYLHAPNGEAHDCIIVHELITGHRITLHGDARENLHSIALGPDIVAFTTYTAKLYVQKLSDPSRPSQSVRLPSMVQAIQVDGHVVGVLYDRGTSVSRANMPAEPVKIQRRASVGDIEQHRAPPIWVTIPRAGYQAITY